MDLRTLMEERRARVGSDLGRRLYAATAGAVPRTAPLRLILELYSPPADRPHDLLLGAPLPLLDLPLLLLDDLGVAEAARQRAEPHLFAGAFFAAVVVLLNELLLGAESEITAEYAALVPGLTHEIDLALAEVVPEADALERWTSPAWDAHHAALLDFRAGAVGHAGLAGAEAEAAMAGRWAPLKAPLGAAALLAGREELLPDLFAAFDEAAALFQLGRDATSINRDLARGHFTVPIREALQRGGLDRERPPVPASRERAASPGPASLGPGPAAPQSILLALMITGALPELATRAEARAAAVAERVATLGLERIAQAWGSLAAPFRELRALYETAAAPEAPSPFYPWSLSPEPAVVRACRAADAYLASDPSFREAWDVRRLGEDEPRVDALTPRALILENLAAAGAILPEAIDALFGELAQTGLAPPRDGDLETLGALLRLLPHAPDRSRAWGTLAPALAALGALEDAPLPSLAGFVTGLLACPEAPPNLVEEAIAQTHASLDDGAIDRDLYTAWRMLELCRALFERGDAEQPGSEGAALPGLSARGTLAPLDTALLILAARASERAPEPAWVDFLLRSQRVDGAWDDDALLRSMGPDGPSEGHRSRMVTTSLCRRALTAST